MPGLTKEERRIRQTLQAQIDSTEAIASEAREEAFTPFPTRRILGGGGYVSGAVSTSSTGAAADDHGGLDGISDDGTG